MMLLSVCCTEPSRVTEAISAAKQLKLPFNQPAQVQVCLTSTGWILKKENWLPLSVSLLPHRMCSKQDGLIRACQPKTGRRILDLTAGWGRDAAMLASFGASITLIERDPILALLLQEAIARTHGASAGPFTLIHAEAASYLAQLEKADYPDVIYYDPMHPIRSKSAKVKKALQCLQTWIQPDQQAASLLQQARGCVLERVVVKWPSREPPLASPDFSFKGKTVRYDVFLPSGKA